MKQVAAALLALCVVVPSCAGFAQRPEVKLYCHRTANEDVPENTLESLEQAALLGCNVIEIDLRRTRDGELVLNHDGILERLSDGLGEVKDTNYPELGELDLGSWMSPRFAGLHVARFVDALRIARRYKVRLALDIKEKGIGAEVVRAVDEEGMRAQVEFGGERDDIKVLLPEAKTPGDGAAWVQPGFSAEIVQQAHQEGKMVVANFSANDHEMDLAAMRAAVTAGVDAINVDYPRLGADAVGRPVEEVLRALILKANAGEAESRSEAILRLARFRGFALQEHFLRWLLDGDSRVSRAAAQAIVLERPKIDPVILTEALHSPVAAVRANAVWAVAALHGPLRLLMASLSDQAPSVRQMALFGVARTRGHVRASVLLPFLHDEHQEVRGVAARALAVHQPQIAVRAIAAQLDKEVAAERLIFDDRKRRGVTTFTQGDIEVIMRSFRCQMEMVRALSSVPGREAVRELVRLALRPEKDFSQYNAIVASFQLWDRIASDPEPLIAVLGSENADLAGRAEWTLAHAGAEVLPSVRAVLSSSNARAHVRAMHILAWQGDSGSLAALRPIAASHSSDAELAAWAVARIRDLHPAL